MIPKCNENNCNGEIVQLSLKTNRYNNGVWFMLNESDVDVWYRCNNCYAEYNESEIKELLK